MGWRPPLAVVAEGAQYSPTSPSPMERQVWEPVRLPVGGGGAVEKQTPMRLGLAELARRTTIYSPLEAQSPRRQPRKA